MLTIRMQRTGRTGHAQFRLVAQDRRFSPLSGRVTANLGSYDPHSKKAQLDAEKIAYYLEKGAQPSPRAVKLLKAEGIKLPKWVSQPAAKKKAIRNPEKLRKNRPAEPKADAKPAEPAAEEPTSEVSATDAAAEDTKADAPADQPTEEKPSEEIKSDEAATEDKPAEEPKSEEVSTDEPKSETPAEDAASES